MRLFRRSKKHRTLPPHAPQRRVLFVTHEATRTGAPKIILNLMKHFRQNCDVCCETIMHSGGPLGAEFHQHSHLADCFNHPRNQPRQRTASLTRKVKRVLNRAPKNAPLIALCNSMESRFVGAELAAQGIPVISLLHELPSSYKAEDYQAIFDQSEHVIFPVNEVFEAVKSTFPTPAHKTSVMSQGLLDPEFGEGIEAERARTWIRNELSLPSDSFIVLGCGTLDLRKGIDHFAAVARRVAKLNAGSERPIHFVWVGGGPQWTHSPLHYVQLDLKQSGADQFVHFIGERPEVEPYFVGSDAFFMSSRVDPFPCVIHEAMAARLPVITFADSGGAQSAVGDGGGFVVPYADYENAASLITTLAQHSHIATAASERAFERVHREYRFEDYGNEVIELCEGILGVSLRNQDEARPRLRIAA